MRCPYCKEPVDPEGLESHPSCRVLAGLEHKERRRQNVRRLRELSRRFDPTAPPQAGGAREAAND